MASCLMKEATRGGSLEKPEAEAEVSTGPDVMQDDTREEWVKTEAAGSDVLEDEEAEAEVSAGPDNVMQDDTTEEFVNTGAVVLEDNLNTKKGVIILDSVGPELSKAEYDTVSSLLDEEAFSDNEEFNNCLSQLDNSSPFSDDEEFLRCVSQFENSSSSEKADANVPTLSSPQLENLRGLKVEKLVILSNVQNCTFNI